MNASTKPPAAARLFYRLAIILLIVLPVAPLGVRLGLWHHSIGLALCTLALLGSFLIQIIHSIWLLRKPPQATKRLLRKTSLVALPPLLVAAAIIREAGDKPMIHDISTDTESPPEFAALLAERRPEHNSLTISAEVLSQQRRAYPQLQPLLSTLPPEQALLQAAATAEQLGWRLYQLDQQQGRLEATATTLWFGFVDDIVVRVRPHQQGSIIDLRSASRVGQGDLGANAKRIEAFIKAFKSARQGTQ